MQTKSNLRFSFSPPTRLLYILFLAIMLFHPSRGIAGDRTDEVAAGIKRHFESHLYTLDPATQKHYALRLYRVTGDTSYIYPIIFDLAITLDDLQQDVDHFNDSGYISCRAAELTEDFNNKTRKGRLRQELFEQLGPALFYLNVLYNTSKVEELGLETPRFDALTARSRQLLSQVDFSRFLLDTELVRVFAPQAVNYVYYLETLHISDIRDQYRDIFRGVFADSLDSRLTRKQYRDKIYGLTHFILAASEYYQHQVDDSGFSWILSYFSQHMDRILSDCTEDIISEVGICFLLTGHSDSEVVPRCRETVIAAYSKKHHMILSPQGNDDLRLGEHRNSLGYMLLRWPEKLHAGPRLGHMDQFLRLFPTRTGQN